MARTLVGRHIKLALSAAEVTARGWLWIVCAAWVTDSQALPAEGREATIVKAVVQATEGPMPYDEGMID